MEYASPDPRSSEAFSTSCQFHSPGFQGFLDKVYDFDILYILGSLLSSFAGPYHMPFIVNPGHS